MAMVEVGVRSSRIAGDLLLLIYILEEAAPPVAMAINVFT